MQMEVQGRRRAGGPKARWMACTAADIKEKRATQRHGSEQKPSETTHQKK